jgi:tRNA threonylcarbamoyladenosine biosynthesis protein TsaB
MIVLGIDSSTKFASVAVLRDGLTLAEARGDDSARGADLLVLIDSVCAGAAIEPNQIDAVAVGAGPGSFTGLRIGMATAKGIAFAASCPLWAVSSLAALAYEELHAEPDQTVVAVLDARKSEVYAGAYRRADQRDRYRVVAVGEERVMAPELIADFAPPGARIAGDFIEILAGHPVTFPRRPSGAAVAKLALEGARVDVSASGAPTYIRPSEAEVKYPDGVPGALKRR